MTLFYLFQVNLTLEREVAGVWIKVPCVDDLGSCYYPDACVRLAQLFMMIPELCPEPKRSSSVPCGCPFRAVSVSSFTEHPHQMFVYFFISGFLCLTFICFFQGDYYWPSSGIYIPNFSLSNRLTNFRLQIILGNAEKELGCLKVSFSIASVLYNQHNEM